MKSHVAKIAGRFDVPATEGAVQVDREDEGAALSRVGS